MGILIKLDDYGKDAYMKKISLDVFDISSYAESVRMNFSMEKDLLGGISAADGNSDAELQRVVDEMWGEIQEFIAKKLK